MSLSDLKHSLRKFDFPASAREALIRIEQLLTGRGAPSSKQMDIAMEVISEFVFCESDRRGGRRGSGLNPLQELQLIDIICDYLACCSNETTKNTVFLSLFGGMDTQRRLKVLSILASLAISASSTPVLLAVGVWLQQTGCSSPQSLQLAESIIRDHFQLNTVNQSSLSSLATTAPQFVANFITAVTELYMKDAHNKRMPPKNLLEVITSWVSSSPALCMCAQLNPCALPSGAIPMAVVTPLAGLVHWCALAPLYIDIDDDTEMVDLPVPPKKIKMENETEQSTGKANTGGTLSESQLYIQLHLGVLSSLRSGRRAGGASPASPASPASAAVSAQHLLGLVPCVQAYAHRQRSAGVALHADTRLQDCLDRIGQAVQVALANGCVYGNISNLLAALDTLPANRLLSIVVNAHRQTV